MNGIVEQILDDLRGAWRFRWIAMSAAWITCVAGWLVVLSMSDVYEASARVFVDTRTALKPLLEGLAVESDVNAQLNMVKQAMLGRPHLERVAKQVGLDAQVSGPEAMAGLVDRIRAQITIQGGAARDATGGLYVISYRGTDRQKSLEVVDSLVNTFVEETLGGKRAGAETAQRFLREQIAEYDKRLSLAEDRLADFKRRNVGMMPAERGDYFERLQSEIDAVDKSEAALAVAMRRRDELEKQLRGEIPYVAGAGATAAAGTGRAAAPDTATRIKEMQAKLDEMLLSYTDRHPDVVAARETLVQLEERRRDELEALRRGDPGAAAASGASANPVYQSIQLTLNQTNVEIAALRGEIADRRNKVAQLRALVNTVPEVEAELARLNRDYDVTKAQYTALVDRLEKARISEEAEATGIVRFEVIDPPAVGYDPVEPNRPRLLALVLVVGLGIGGGLAYALHQARPVFNSTRVLNELTGLPVFGSVSMTWLEKHRATRRMQTFAFGGAGAMLVVVFLCTVVFHNVGAGLLGGTSG